MIEIKVGQIFVDNYDYRNGKFRCVKILALPKPGFDSVLIQRCESDGAAIPSSPKTRTVISRFTKSGKAGFTLIKDAA